MERLTYVTEKGEVLFHPEDLPDDEGVTITQLAKDGRFKALEIIAERLANYEQVEKHGSYGKWIPVSERLPEEAYGCLVTVMDYEPSTQTDFENILPYFVGYDGHGWNNADGETIPFEVIAWMPLPEPYRESEEENGK